MMKTVTFDERAWKLVPIEPTNAVLERAVEIAFQAGPGKEKSDWKHYMYLLWGAVIEASPDAPEDQRIRRQDQRDAEHIRNAAAILSVLTSNLDAGHPLRAEAADGAKRAVADLYRIADQIDAAQPKGADHG